MQAVKVCMNIIFDRVSLNLIDYSLGKLKI